ncbi:MAG: MOSC domain-containing protein, partial [Lysobacter sp.]
MQLLSLHLHPLKSAAAIAVDTLDIAARGPRGDRRWLVVDADRRFITARKQAEIVLITALPDGDGLQLSAPGMPAIAVATPAADAARMRVRIWDDEVDAVIAHDDANAWLSAYLKRAVTLVHMDARSRRTIDGPHAQPGDQVSFADGYPLLAISQAALDALNARLASPITMARFRPNLVIAGCAAHAEDGWQRVRIGDLVFEASKACTRCVFTTIDPITGQRDPGGEPLRTL